MSGGEQPAYLQDPAPLRRRLSAARAPFIHAPEGASTVTLVTLAATCGPLLAGAVLFGWRSLTVTALAISGCAMTEWLFYRVTSLPALHGRSHALLTGMLLALTLPPFVPWYVPLVGAAFAIIVGKGIFGGVGHYVWNPALVGRLALMVIFPTLLTSPSTMHPRAWPVIAQNKILIGDVTSYQYVQDYRQWRGRGAPIGADAFLVTRPEATLASLTRGEAAFSALANVPENPQARPMALLELPPINDLIYGAVPGGIGETSAVLIIVAGLYLIYRHYVTWQLPLSIIIAAAVVAAVAPIQLIGYDAAAQQEVVRRVWWPIHSEGLDVGLVYVFYQLVSGELMLVAMFMATETTTRPVTAGGQVLFGLGCGALAMLLKLYSGIQIPGYVAVLIMNTFTQTIDRMWRPRVFGRPRFARLLRWLQLGPPLARPAGGASQTTPPPSPAPTPPRR